MTATTADAAAAVGAPTEPDRPGPLVATAGRHATDDGGRHSARTRMGRRLSPALLVAAVFAVALGVRLFRIRQAYDLFVDEASYATIARNLATGHGLVLYGAPFNLHPPLSFAILAVPVWLFQLAGHPLDQLILALRTVSAVVGAGIVAVVYAGLTRCGLSRWGALTAAAVLVVDPFELKFDSRLMLEPYAQLFVAVSLVLLMVAAARGAGLPPIVAAGVSAGLAMSTKETFSLVLGATLVLLLLAPHLVPRRVTLVVLGTAVGVYAAVTVAVWSTSGFGPWWEAHTNGLARLVGTRQTTGFNAATTKVTLVGRIGANLGEYAPTYALLAVGGLTCVVVLLRRRVWRALPRSGREKANLVAALWCLAACGYLAYATLFGSLEEQMFYIPVVPAVVVVATAWVPGRWARPRAWTATAVVVVTALSLTSAAIWVDRRRADNDRYEQLFAWSRTSLHQGSVVAVTDDLSEFVLHGVTLGRWPNQTAWAAHHVQYVVVDSALVDQGYSALDSTTFQQLLQHAPETFRASANGDTLYLFNVLSMSSP